MMGAEGSGGGGPLDVVGRVASLLASGLVDEVLDEVLAVVGGHVRADRAYVFEYRSARRISNTHEWCAPGIEPVIGMLQDLDAEQFSWSETSLRAGEALLLDVRALPPEAEAEREVLEAQGILTLALVPIGRGAELRGFVGLDAVAAARDWEGEPVAVLRWMAHLLDVSMAREADRRARQVAEEYIRRFADQASEAIFLYDAEVRQGLYANPAFETLLGVSRDAWAQDWRRSLAPVFPAEELAAIDTAVELIRAGRWRELLDDRGCVFRGEQRLLGSPEGRWLFTIMFPIVGSDGALAGFGAICEETTERKRLEAELVDAVARAEDANTSKSRFLARVSHELLNPLHALLGFTELLAAMDGLPSEGREYLQHVDTAGRRLAATVSDLLDLSRVDSGEMTVDLAPTDLAPLVEAVVALLAPGAADAGVSVTVDELGRHLAWTDPARLEQVLINLVSNGVKYTASGGTVRLSAHREGDRVVLQVADTGIGMTPDQVGRAFTPFERLGRELTPIPGTGLGLAIVESITRSLGIGLAVDSAPGEGTTVRLAIPLSG